MKLIGTLALSYAALVLQVVLAREASVGGLRLDLLLLAAAVAAFTLDGSFSLGVAAVIGLLADSLSPGPLGIGMLSMTLFALLIRWGTSRQESFSIVVGTALVFAAGFATLMFSACARSVALGHPLELGHVTLPFARGLGSAVVFWFFCVAWRFISVGLNSFRMPITSRNSNRWRAFSN